jgi:Transposase DDE domain/Transposase domain (DUF772)
MNKESRYVKVARIAYQLAQVTLPRYSHAKSPHHFTLPQLATCVLLTFYMDMSYRDMEEWLLATNQVCAVLGLERVPDHSTLSRTFKKLKQADWDRLLKELLRTEVNEEAIAADSTSFRLNQASLHYYNRAGKAFTDWIKGAYVVGTQSLLILGWASSRGSLPDFGFRQRLYRQAARYGRYQGKRRMWWLLADKGFDSGSFHAADLIPPIRRYGKITDPERHARADRVSEARLAGLYGQRWKCETVHSVIKRKFGDTIRSRSLRLQRREPIVKGLVYNIHV